MDVVLTRDSVCAGDDVDAPHTSRIRVADDATLEMILSDVIAAGYLASISGGKATWLVKSKLPVAVIAQQWAKPRLLPTASAGDMPLEVREGAICLHFHYHAQEDPDEVFAELTRKVNLPLPLMSENKRESSMKQVLWSLLAIVVAVIVGGITVGIVEIPGYFIHPPPPGMSFNDMEGMKAHAAKAPPLAMAFVALAWAAGPFVGTLVACLIVRKKFVVHGMIIGTIFALLDASNYAQFPHPLWLMVAGIVFPFLASSAAAFLANRLFPPKACPHQPFDMRKKNMACK